MQYSNENVNVDGFIYKRKCEPNMYLNSMCIGLIKLTQTAQDMVDVCNSRVCSVGGIKALRCSL